MVVKNYVLTAWQYGSMAVYEPKTVKKLVNRGTFEYMKG